MNNSEVLEKLKAYLKCQKRQVKGIYEDCNNKKCDNCDLCHMQGTRGEHIEAVEVAAQAFEKLADYEDLEELIGIPMKELAKIFRQHIPDGCQHPQKAIVLTDGDVDKWQKYKDLEEQGRLIKLPCKFGTEVYNITWWDNAQEKVVVKGNSYYRTVYKHKVTKSTFSYLDIDEFGKTVFLTKSEAKAKLKELGCKENRKDI